MLFMILCLDNPDNAQLDMKDSVHFMCLMWYVAPSMAIPTDENS